MARFETLKSSRFASLAPAGKAGEIARNRRRYAAQPWRAWYSSKRWQDLKATIHVRDRHRCQMCGILCRGAANAPDSPVCDHRTSHQGDEELFWSPGNLQTLCKACHDGRKQKLDRVGGSVSSGAMAMPDWFRPVFVPLTIVCGPPASGKSTYVRTRQRPGDMLVCFEAITAELFGPGRLHAEAGDSRIGDVLRRRNDMLGSLMRASARGTVRHAWLILTEPRADRRQWWVDTVKPREVVVLETPAAVCIERAAADAANGDVRSALAVAAIKRWWSDYTRRDGDTVIQAGGGSKV